MSSENGNQTTDSGRDVTPEPGPSNVTKETSPIRKRRRSSKSVSPKILHPTSPRPGHSPYTAPIGHHHPQQHSTIHHYPRQPPIIQHHPRQAASQLPLADNYSIRRLESFLNGYPYPLETGPGFPLHRLWKAAHDRKIIPRICVQRAGIYGWHCQVFIEDRAMFQVRALTRERAQETAMDDALKYLEAPSVRAGEFQDALRLISESLKYLQDSLRSRN